MISYLQYLYMVLAVIDFMFLVNRLIAWSCCTIIVYRTKTILAYYEGRAPLADVSPFVVDNYSGPIKVEAL